MKLRTSPLHLAAAISLSLAASACAAGPTPSEAKAFLAGLFTGYEKPEPPDLLGEGAATVFTPKLVALIHQDAAQAQGEAGALDYDPVCGCQDFAISNVVISVAQLVHGKTGAVVEFDNAGHHKTIRFDLASVQGRWRIADIHDKRVPSLVEFLRQHTAKTPATRPKP